MNNEQTNSVFGTLSKIDVSKHTEKKNGLTYLSWAWAWSVVKEHYPNATYTIYENQNGWCYFTDNLTGWVKTGVTIEGIEHIEYLPIMDFRNKSIPCANITSFDVNKTIQRSLTKACARHGLGLYIYAGEDLPNNAEPQQQPKQTKSKQSLEPTHEKWNGAIEALQNRTCDINFIKERFILTPENEKLLIEQAQF